MEKGSDLKEKHKALKLYFGPKFNKIVNVNTWYMNYSKTIALFFTLCVKLGQLRENNIQFSML